MKILVTGGAGYIGSHTDFALCEVFFSLGYSAMLVADTGRIQPQRHHDALKTIVRTAYGEKNISTFVQDDWHQTRICEWPT